MMNHTYVTTFLLVAISLWWCATILNESETILVRQKIGRERRSDNKVARQPGFVTRVRRQIYQSKRDEEFPQEKEGSTKNDEQMESFLSPLWQPSPDGSSKSIYLCKKNGQRSVPASSIPNLEYSVPFFKALLPLVERAQTFNPKLLSVSFDSPSQAIQNVPNQRPLFCMLIPISKKEPSLVPGSKQLDTFSKNDFNSREIADCPVDFIRCSDGSKCVPKSSWCDNKVDCLDASDESTCTCLDRISESKLCDNYHDCPQGEDELGCFDCPKDKFSCVDENSSTNSDRNCIEEHERCDGKNHCDNGIDEKGCIILNNNLTTLNEMFPVGYSSGFIHVHKNRWYIACGYTYEWAVEACKTELGSLSSEPKVKLLPNFNLSSTGPYITPEGSTKDTCPSFLHVECPSPILGSNMIATVADPELVGIIGGRDSLPLAWPFVVGIVKNGRFHCGGVVLDNLWILSAAHCFRGYKNSYYEVDAGSLRRQSYSPTLQSRRIVGLVIHENYRPSTFSDDIALALLDEHLSFNSWVRPVRLPEPASALPSLFGWLWQDTPSLGTKCTVVGWGSIQEGGPDPDYLREVDVPVVRCRHLEDIGAGTLCAGYWQGGRDSCQGDSGGPLMCRVPNSNSEWYIGGIVSHGLGCGRFNEPGIYTKVSQYINWTNNVVQSSRNSAVSLSRPLSRCPGFSCSRSRPTRCLPGSKRCDSKADCLGAEDEDGCPAFNYFGMFGKSFGATVPPAYDETIPD